MARKVLDNYPAYMKDFEEIEAFAAGHEWEISMFKESLKQMLQQLKVNAQYNNAWIPVMKWESYDNNFLKKHARRFFEKHDVTTKDDVERIIGTVTGRDDLKLDFSSENLLFSVHSTKTISDNEKRKIRQVVPCNMALDFVIADKV